MAFGIVTWYWPLLFCETVVVVRFGIALNNVLLTIRINVNQGCVTNGGFWDT